MKTKTIIAMGVFDGVHQGHRHIFKKIIQRSKKIRAQTVAYTFEPHPVRVLAPHACPQMINTIPQRIELICDTGMDRVVVEKFTKTFAKQTPQQFVKNVILKKLKPSEIFVGYNFTFGIKRSGTAEDLQKLCAQHQIQVHIVTPYYSGETLVSSTQVRHFLNQGDLARANHLLERPYFLDGSIVKGKGIGAKLLGIPTANLKTFQDHLLPMGVYITKIRIGKKTYSSVTNIGHNPTFQKKGKPPVVTIETHIFNFNKNIVGRNIRLFFFKKIRDEKKFSSPQELIQQIHEDIKQAKKFRT